MRAGGAAGRIAAYGVATVDVAQPIQLELGRLAGLASGAGFPMAVTCDDVQVLKGVALATDTVAVCPVGVWRPRCSRARWCAWR